MACQLWMVFAGLAGLPGWSQAKPAAPTILLDSRFQSLPTCLWGPCEAGGGIAPALAEGLHLVSWGGGEARPAPEDGLSPRRQSERTYPARFLSRVAIRLDGRVDEPEWAQAHEEKGFSFPWKKAAAPRTAFRALCDSEHLYFAFVVDDSDIVVLDRLGDEEDAVFEDRVELYFSRDEQMREYYCLEVDSRGRVFDYRGAYYRKLDPAWNCPGVEAKSAPRVGGYAVEGRIPLASLRALGFPLLRPGEKIRCGLYRAEFHHDRSGRPAPPQASIHTRGRQLDGPPPIEDWLSWIDPRTEEPDFHVPTSLGWLEIVR